MQGDKTWSSEVFKDGDADEGKSYKKKQLDREGKVREIVDSLKEHFF